jgi:hypothetical protein
VCVEIRWNLSLGAARGAARQLLSLDGMNRDFRNRGLTRRVARFARWTSVAVALVGCSGEDHADFVDEPTSVERAALTAQDVQPFAPPVPWTGSTFSGTRGTYFADVTGDGRADAIAHNDTSIAVRKSNGAPLLATSTNWLNVAFVGSVGTYFADVTNDGAADAIAINSNNVLVRPSNGTSAFGSSQTWSTTGFSGSIMTLVADVSGDGRADLVALNTNGIVVRVATPNSFASPGVWSNLSFSNSQGTFAADVNGDGKLDLVGVNSTNVLVRPSSGSGFNATQTWSSTGFFGQRGTFIVDVTGDKLADLVAVNNNEIKMRRSSGWFFGTSQEVMSTVSTSSTALKRFADLTRDGRADYIEVGSTIVGRSRQDRPIPLRIVQFVKNCAEARTDTQIQQNIDDANLAHKAAGVRFEARTVSSNPDCSGPTKSHVVLSTILSAVTSTTPASQSELNKAKNRFNSACDIGYEDMQDLGLNEQIWWVGARCSVPGEALVYVADVGTNAANNAGDGNLVLLDRNDGFNVLTGRFGHELGHYLGLNHTFFGYGGLLGGIDPDTGQGERMSDLWDLVSAGSTFFNSRAEALLQETSLSSIESQGSGGWFCPSGDPNKPCPFASPPAGTIGVPIGGNTSNVLYTYLPQSTTFDVRAKGLAPRQPSNLPGINVMSYSYLPSDPPNLKRSVSLSQIEIVQRNLARDVLTKYLDANGQVIFGKRQLLGIDGPAATVTYTEVGPTVARTTVGSIASNSYNVWMVSTSTFNSEGFAVYRYDPRLRVWTAANAGAHQVALPSGGADTPWAITGAVPGPVKRWNGSTFANLPADPNATGCARSLAVGDHVSGTYAWAVSCQGPNLQGNFRIARYSDSTGWQFLSGAADGWGTQVAVDWEGVPWAKTILPGGATTLFKAVMNASGTLTSWVEVPPPSGVTPSYLTGGAASASSRLPVNFIGTDNRLYGLEKSTLTFSEIGSGLPFLVAAAGGAMPYLWVVGAGTGTVAYAR